MRRAVFSDAQRSGLERRFQIQKYISKPDRRKLAEKLGLKDSQVSLSVISIAACELSTPEAGKLHGDSGFVLDGQQ